MYLFLPGFLYLTLCMTKLRVTVLSCSCFTDNSINWDWVHVLLSHNGHPVDGALVTAGSLSPICSCTLSGSAGAGTWTASSVINSVSLVHSWYSLSFCYTYAQWISLVGTWNPAGHWPQMSPTWFMGAVQDPYFCHNYTTQQHVNKYTNSW
jgi:hypothetical protein